MQPKWAPEVSRDQGRRSKRIVMIVVRVGRGDAGSCRHGCTEDWRGVVALVAVGDGADAERARQACTSSRAGKVPHGGGVRARRCAVAIVMVIIVFGSARGRCAHRCDAGRGRRAARSRVGARGQTVVRTQRSGDGRSEGNREDVQRFAITIGAACRSP